MIDDLLIHAAQCNHLGERAEPRRPGTMRSASDSRAAAKLSPTGSPSRRGAATSRPPAAWPVRPLHRGPPARAGHARARFPDPAFPRCHVSSSWQDQSRHPPSARPRPTPARQNCWPSSADRALIVDVNDPKPRPQGPRRPPLAPFTARRRLAEPSVETTIDSMTPAPLGGCPERYRDHQQCLIVIKHCTYCPGDERVPMWERRGLSRRHKRQEKWRTRHDIDGHWKHWEISFTQI